LRGREAEAIATAAMMIPPISTTTTPRIATTSTTDLTVFSASADDTGNSLVPALLPPLVPVALAYSLNCHRAPQCGQDVPFACSSLTCLRQLEHIGTCVNVGSGGG
jgi:hypothetical protein